MQATARRLSVVSATSCARRRLIRDVRLTNDATRHDSIPYDEKVHQSFSGRSAIASVLWLPVVCESSCVLGSDTAYLSLHSVLGLSLLPY